jgi:glutamate-1-semialdehyde 2,1-aminomutase
VTGIKIETSTSKELFERANRVIPGGVNSPVRAFTPFPFFTEKSSGSKLLDVDGKFYIDYCMAYGPLILGHVNKRITDVVKEQLNEGTMFGTPSLLEVEFAELIAGIFPCVDKVRVVSSGTEATMHALRVARGFTGRDKIVKFEGCYHGAHDYVLVKAGSGASTFGSPDSLGVPKDTVKNTLIIPYNNIDAFEDLIRREGDNIAAVILEPIIGNAGVILPKTGFLQYIRKITEEKGILLIFDEVITGCRIALGGAQEYYNVTPDIVTLGKIIGGGFPIGAYGGREEIMNLVSPVGKVYQAGTLSGNPISISAGLTALKILRKENKIIYGLLQSSGNRIRKGIIDIARDEHLSVQVNGIGSMFQIFFTKNPVFDYNSAKRSDLEIFRKYHRKMLAKSIFLPPSQFETCFLSTSHTDEDIDKTLESVSETFKEIGNS